MSLCCSWAQSQAWPVDIMAAICQAESGGNPNAIGDNGDSIGLGQVNLPAHPQFAGLNLTDPAVNAQAAFEVYQSQGLSAWSTYNNGTYRQYLGMCGSSPVAAVTLSAASVGGLPAGTLVVVGVLAVALLLGAEAAGGLA